ncbi:N-acetyllactosaminide beta-1,3-N-acetylglucosaminyltransferase 2 [Conger conger]|uniref:N-acetyllactosaminide beta-1,3-N-acetylglucosaminyltransferase 2 n=1 Tax=Conger conger TaxID=82655 RepID=UPI002A5AC4AE|nr:N-acetyllactosaminide beta-1,3-N-acetylglucosaminyltransferase 2 [Conger conger]XP_061072932.1 N-acetyllactosaminide beta-1,3-N-acetylglucosaminyltransferase 2 [Conger conger]
MWRTKVMVAMVIASSLALVLFYSSLNLEEVHRRKAFVEAANTVLVVPARRNATLHATLHATLQAMTTGHPQTTSRSPQQKEATGISILISTKFIQDVPKSSAYWNRRQHALLKLLESGSSGNATENKILGWPDCGTTSLERLVTNIQDFGTYPPLYQVFLQGMECRDPPILIDQPGKCTSDEWDGKTFLLLAIKSIPQNFERRQAVRKTWGREGRYEGGVVVRTIFLLGRSPPEDPDLGALVSFEALHYRDILQWDFRESFYNLTLKDNAFMSWAARSCPGVAFIFKGDDDVFANTPAILAFLHSLDPTKAAGLYTGHVVTNASPFRDAKSKYYVPVSFYEGAYPAYAGGGGFLFSGSLIRPLLTLSRFIPFFPIDDVYTAMCFKALGITPVAHSGFQTFDIREEDRQNACVHRALILVHQRSPQQMLRLWRDMHSPLLTC